MGEHTAHLRHHLIVDCRQFGDITLESFDDKILNILEGDVLYAAGFSFVIGCFVAVFGLLGRRRAPGVPS